MPARECICFGGPLDGAMHAVPEMEFGRVSFLYRVGHNVHRYVMFQGRFLYKGVSIIYAKDE